jgi:hypothetical protein
MDKPHKQVVATSPVAIKSGQTRIHVSDSHHPWHRFVESVHCPDCETVYIVTTGFSTKQFLETLKKHHKDKEEHPDYIASDPEFTSVSACGCTLGQ